MAGRLFQRPGLPGHKFPSLQPGLLTGPVPPRAYGTQEAVDISISGWSRGTTLLAQGAVPAFIFAAAQFFDPSNAQGQVFDPAPGPAVTKVSNFVSAGQQQYVDSLQFLDAPQPGGFTPRVVAQVTASQADSSQIQPTVFKSAASAPVATTGFLGVRITAAPENTDLSISGWSRGTALLAQGAVPPGIYAAPQLDLTPPSAVYKSTRAAIVVSGIVPQGIYASPPDPTQQFGSVWDSAINLQGGTIGFEIRMGGHSQALYDAEAGKSKVWRQTTTPPVSGILASFFSVPPQADPTQRPPVLTPVSPTPPVVLGPTLYQTLFAGPQLLDLTQQAYIQQAIQVGIVVPPVIVIPPGDQGSSVRHRHTTLLEREQQRKKLFRKKKIRFNLPKEQQEIIEEIVEEAQKPDVSRETLKVQYIEELARWLGDREKATAKTLAELFDADVEARKQEQAQLLAFDEEEEEAIAILTAWWMNEG